MNSESVATRAEVEPRATVPQRSVLVSVIIPAYNAAADVVRALKSVLSQTYRDFEIILINDGSPDTDLLERAIAPYLAQIRYLKQETRGPSGARNTGVLASRGKYVAFLDSDDVWFPEHLAQQVAMLQADPSLDLVYADSILMRGGRTVANAFALEIQHPPVTFEKVLTEDCTIGTSSTVASRQLLIDAGLFDERFRCCEDFDLWLRLAFRGARMDYHSAPHVVHHLWAGSLSGNRLRMKRARIEVYEKTAATLPISLAQRDLIRRLIAKTEAECQTDLAKIFLHTREYGKALQAVRLASVTKRGWRMRLATLGLRTWPGAFRCCHIAYETMILNIAARLRRARLLRKLTAVSVVPTP